LVKQRRRYTLCFCQWKHDLSRKVTRVAASRRLVQNTEFVSSRVGKAREFFTFSGKEAKHFPQNMIVTCNYPTKYIVA
jgi:hypothetical protein